jgi:galactose mutarotase-like enzyme
MAASPHVAPDAQSAPGLRLDEPDVSIPVERLIGVCPGTVTSAACPSPLRPTADVATVCLTEGSVAARFEPGAGMIGTSLTDDGVELLGQGRGLRRYVDSGDLFGLPILHPWANRLGEFGYAAQGVDVSLSPGQPGIRTDENGLVIHGLLAGYPGWRVEELTENQVIAALDFGGDPALMAGFPYPHEVSMRITLRDRTLTIVTTVVATADLPVPLCFGYHPYLTIPEVPRSEWVLDLPQMRHLTLDEVLLPTGGYTDHPATVVELGGAVYDDGFDGVADGALFAVSGGDRRIEVHFECGYPAAQVYAPSHLDVVCFEPMAAPTDALRRGGYRSALLDEPVEATFSIRV